ncbi:glycosyltransferase family 4 protein [bacterium]|nr:glycosyltransferase family 4 protein [bacterium]
MKIVLINYHYFIHGGPDRYFFNIKDLLEGYGHQVIPFSLRYEETISNPYEKYFPVPISGSGTYLIENMRLSFGDKMRYAIKMFYNKDLNDSFRALLDAERPDIVYSIYLSSSIIPYILKIAKEEYRLPVYYRLSDYHIYCPSYLSFRDGSVCVDCIKNKKYAFINRCVKKSYIYSFLRILQIKVNEVNGCYDVVDKFVCPSIVMKNQMLAAGISDQRLVHIPTFARDIKMDFGDYCGDGYFLYFGKIVPEKGMDILFKAYDLIDGDRLNMKVVVYCDEGYKEHLMSYIKKEKRGDVEFMNNQNNESLWEILNGASFVVQPGLWLENMPNTIIEAFSAGKAVIASNLGSYKELVVDKKNGLLVEPGNVQDLAIAIKKMFNCDISKRYGLAARKKYEKEYSSEIHYKRLMNVFVKN